MLHPKLISEIAVVVLLIFVAFLISLHLPGFEWETDYGHYYYISMFNDGNKEFYNDFFIHKGPVAIFVLDIVGFLIGYGWKQSIISYFAAIILLISSFYFFIRYETKNLFLLILSFIFFFTFFRNQGSNIYIELILNSFLFLSLIFFKKYIQTSKANYLYLFIFLYSLSIYTRIDAIIYTIVFFIIFIIYILRENKIKELNIFFFIKFLALSFIVLIIFSFFYNFSFNDFLINNVYFNIEYGNSEDYLKFRNLDLIFHLTPNKILTSVLIIKALFYFFEKFDLNKRYNYLLVLISIIQAIIYLKKLNYVYLFNLIYFFEILTLLFIFFKKKKYSNYNLLIAVLLNFSSIFIFLYSGSLKINHIFMLLFGYCVFFIFFVKFLFDKKFKFKRIIIFIFIILNLDQVDKIYSSIKNPIINNEYIKIENGLQNFFYDPKYINENEVVNKIGELNTPVICDRGWLHVFNEKISNGFMLDWWFYDDHHKIKRKDNVENLVNDIIDKHYSNYFLIEKECVENKRFSENYLIKKNNK